ncbi:HTH-type transcriptional repressor [Luteimicrobium xylanilyticum]|uniref:HTH-type transcriptional repressor n=1 Tax=Luteimicrobium xylanilyticum TaxID=1133546 RepID=A0A5P9QG23_9MICO|nr:LacI family DNA-binding transcriptional regulator [Luteimicrobium xylanilyticum]QFU99980.1 HTH-type transcriptional repressor [Luteimicrobium xylanilyticum]
MEEGKRPTLRAVADLAGTTVPTVSKVLHGRTDVSAVMRRAVLDAVDQVGYRRSPGMQVSADRSTPNLVDMVMASFEGTWANRALAGVESAANDAGISVVITIANGDDEWVSRLMRRHSTGAIIVGVGPSEAQLAGLRAAKIPVVLVDPLVRPPDDVASVGSTDWAGGHSAGTHLLELGHRRIGVIDGGTNSLFNAARLDGFRSALQSAGLSTRPEWCAPGYWNRTRACAAASVVLQQPERPTAMFALTESMAFGVYDAAAQLGIRIPDDLSVVAYDDLPEAQWANPAMTTVQQPTAEMGAIAVQLLLKLVDPARQVPQEGPATRVELATRLVARASTAPPPT